MIIKKHKFMINIYLKIIKKLKDEIFSLTDEFEDEKFVFGDNSLGFRFQTDDNLVYDEKIIITVCVILLSSVIKKAYREKIIEEKEELIEIFNY